MTYTKNHTIQRLVQVIDGLTYFVQFVDMTPELAAKYMARNGHNRKIKLANLRMMTGDMIAGDFPFNGAAILLADDGTLIDGQHRLQAVIDSGETITMLVISGFKMVAQENVDTGAKRALADVLHLRGETNCNELAALAKLANSWNSGNRSTIRFHQASNQELLRFIDRNPDVRDALKPTRNFAKKYGVSKSHMSLAYWVLNRISPADNAEFWKLLGEPQQSPNAIAALQASLVRDMAAKAKGQNRLPIYQLALVLKTWNCFMTAKPMTQMRFKIGGASPDQWPEPVRPLD